MIIINMGCSWGAVSTGPAKHVDRPVELGGCVVRALERKTHDKSAASRNVDGGGVRPRRVEGRVTGSDPVQKQPHPEGQIGTATPNEFQQDI